MQIRKTAITAVTLLLTLLTACGTATPAATNAPVVDTPAPRAATARPTGVIAASATAAPTAETSTKAAAADGDVQGWAVLAEKDDYTDGNMSNLPVDYIGITQMREVLEAAGWDTAHIREDREFDRASLESGLDWLEDNADQDDIVVLYVGAHSMYLQQVLRWDTFFAEEWAEIPSYRRVLVIDACQAASFTSVILEDPAPFLAIAAVGGEEYAWSGLEEEGLPIIGGVFTYYFAAAFGNPAADADRDGRVSIQEAADLAEQQQRTYLHEVVLAVPEFVEGYHEIGAYPEKDRGFPHVTVDDTIGEPLYLALDAYRPTATSTAQPPLDGSGGRPIVASLSFEQSPQSFPKQPTYQIALGDLDGDGDLDAVFASPTTIPSQVWLNDGHGHFTDSGQELTPQGHGVGVGDLDGDGDLDLFFTCETYRNRPERSKVYLNDGKGTFQHTGQDLGDLDLSGNGIVLADVDGDGDLDAVVEYYQSPYRIYLNDGQGWFSTSEVTLPGEADLSWGDLNGDGHTDVFVKEWGSGYTTLLNDGTGHFAAHWSMDHPQATWGGVTLGDLDQDGDLDAVVSNGDRSASYPTTVWLNDGRGGFADSGQEVGLTTSAWIGLGDLDGDGDLDMYVANFGRPNEVWINAGQGLFRDSGLRLGDDDMSREGGLGDLDGDGDLDAIVPFFGLGAEGASTIWLNGQR